MNFCEIGGRTPPSYRFIEIERKKKKRRRRKRRKKKQKRKRGGEWKSEKTKSNPDSDVSTNRYRTWIDVDIERGTGGTGGFDGRERRRIDRQTDGQTDRQTDGRALSPSPQKQEAQPRYSSNFSRRNIHEQPRPSVLFRFYSPLQMGQPGSESLLYEAGNPCRWERVKGEWSGERGKGSVALECGWKEERDGFVVGNRPASTLQLAKVQQQNCCYDIAYQLVPVSRPSSIVSIRHREWKWKPSRVKPKDLLF